MSKWTEYQRQFRTAIPEQRCAYLRVLLLGTDFSLGRVVRWDSVDGVRRTVRRHLTGECPCDHDVPPLVRDSDGVWRSQNTE